MKAKPTPINLMTIMKVLFVKYACKFSHARRDLQWPGELLMLALGQRELI